MSNNLCEDLSDGSSELSQWTDRDDVKLFYSMFNLKPVGLNKHFYMCEIINNMNDIQKAEGLLPVTPAIVWTRLNELYNLKLLEQYEHLPQPLLEEIDFDKFIEQQMVFQTKSGEESDEDKPLAKILMRSESEESKVSGMDTEESSVKGAKVIRKKTTKMEENLSSEEEPTSKTLRSRGRGFTLRKSDSPVVNKRRK
ncbi:probable chromatin modification-related protein eaf7 [Diaphorina citri]|jgi:CT20 family.|uniref:Probable chromatin modification-related protein eaf7 n=1 Tax=Diaphorina citri TaxID=121845 RepID=A0A1S3DCZ6_DIACI|nr:probable chromatin modification-related protein eaf7 [Diaphorina citri]